MLTYVLFFVGFVLLIKGADLLVDGASVVAKRLGVSALVIGLTIVAFGTSVPELVVNLFASLEGNTDLAIGNVLGSNIVNILLILGVSAIFYPLTVQKSTVWKEVPFALLAVTVLGFMANDMVLNGEASSAITRSEGLILIAFFVIFLYYIFGISKGNTTDQTEEVAAESVSLVRSLLMVVVGILGLVVGGKWIVDGAVAIATGFGVSEALIGLTIVAIGTSLPEMATSVVAAYKKNVDIAVGNVVGSNIFNVFWILGVSSIVQPLPFSQMLSFDLGMTFGATLLLFLAFFIGKRHTLERWQGVLFVVLYLTYILYLVLRG